MSLTAQTSLAALALLFMVSLPFSKATAETAASEIRDFSERPDLAPQTVVSGTVFLTPESRSLQNDEFGNPGLLWVDRGERLFRSGEKSCASCHEAGGKRALNLNATGYPKFDDSAGKVINLEQRINVCRVEHQDQKPFAWESEDLLGLTAYVTQLAKGQSFEVDVSGPQAAAFAAGREYFFSRKGQLNLACNQCHDDNWGKMLRGDKMSQGHPNAFPAYRIEWQTLGSLHRRIQDCDQGIRAEILPKGSETYVNLELYLKWRAANLKIEAPGIRR